MMKKFFLSILLVFSLFSVAAAQELDYGRGENWAFCEQAGNKTVDVLLICPTVELQGTANADVTDEEFRRKFLGALNMERGIYAGCGRMFAPYYRQVTLPVYYLQAQEAVPYFDRAYVDVKRAFKYYLKHYNNDRPLIIAGFSQGSQLALRLVEEFRPYADFRKRVVAVYAIGFNLTEEQAKRIRGLHPAKGELDTHSIVVFNTEDANVNHSLLVPEGIRSHCINPLNWKTDATKADRAANEGACFTNYEANINREIPGLTGAYIDTQRGVLKVTDIRPDQYPAYILPDGVYHIYDYQFFYRNLQENVRKRVREYFK